ncbi:MAG: beta-lactamase family protein, partial [Maribacter sp.]|nr:beta-lactamase family protein [Maribacter sp.]
NHYFTHAGGGGGYYCEIRIYPENGKGSVIMFNRTGIRDERFLDNLDNYFIKE